MDPMGYKNRGSFSVSPVSISYIVGHVSDDERVALPSKGGGSAVPCFLSGKTHTVELFWEKNIFNENHGPLNV